MALMFFPRGGSAQVARYVARALPGAGWDVTLVAGSLGDESEASNASVFFEGVADLREVDYTAARDAPDPLAAPPPFQPPFEDRADAPDRVFAAVPDDAYERLVSCWEEVLADACASDAHVLHPHHLTPMNEAASRSCPGPPVIGPRHGTELLMRGAIES